MVLDSTRIRMGTPVPITTECSHVYCRGAACTRERAEPRPELCWKRVHGCLNGLWSAQLNAGWRVPWKVYQSTPSPSPPHPTPSPTNEVHSNGIIVIKTYISSSKKACEKWVIGNVARNILVRKMSFQDQSPITYHFSVSWKAIIVFNIEIKLKRKKITSDTDINISKCTITQSQFLLLQKSSQIWNRWGSFFFAR